MMQTQLPQPSWEVYNTFNSTLDQPAQFSIDDNEFSPSVTNSEESHTNSSDSYIPTFLADEFVEFSFLDDEMQGILPMENITVESFEAISNHVCEWLDASEGEENISLHLPMENGLWSPEVLTESVNIQEYKILEVPPPTTLLIESHNDSELLQSENPQLILPCDEMEIDTQTSLCPLLEAFAEAIDDGEFQVAEVIVGRINEKVSPVGETLERVAFNLFQPMGKQGEYINHESSKNTEAAFKAFYEIFKYGRVPHFAANLAILEAMPGDAETIHIVDFDMGSGIQWPSLIEAVASQNKLLRLTSVKVEDDYFSNTTRWKFEDTKRRLHEYARSFGLKLKVEENTLEDLVKDIENTWRRKGREWLAFNCMVNLPHMRSRRSRSDVMKFVSLAQTILANSTTYKGLLTFGHGEDGEMTKNFSGFSSFFSEKLRHYYAMYESMECSFPTRFAEARLAMESLFLTPYVSSPTCLQRWKEIKNGPAFEAVTGLQGRKVSKEALMELKVIVQEGETLYSIKTDGKNENEMILEWRGSPLVRVSTWM